jgi:hypothetical protein
VQRRLADRHLPRRNALQLNPYRCRLDSKSITQEITECHRPSDAIGRTLIGVDRLDTLLSVMLYRQGIAAALTADLHYDLLGYADANHGSQEHEVLYLLKELNV